MALTKFSKRCMPYIELVVRIVLVVFVSGILYGANAQITFDGSVGVGPHPSFGIPIPGVDVDPEILQDYQILQDYGDKYGTNLFHSFHLFNVDTGQAATFQVDGTVENVISRVTGKYPSKIYGEISVDDLDKGDGANFWIVNPAGIMFGPEAVINVGGTFNVGAADYISHSDKEDIYSTLDNSITLSVANPIEFGFFETELGGGNLSLNGTDLSNVISSLDSGLLLAGRDISITDVDIIADFESVKNAINNAIDKEGSVGSIILTAKNDISIENSEFRPTGWVEASSGSITITANNLIKLDNSTMNTRVVGASGNAGDIKIDGSRVTIIGDRAKEGDSDIFAGGFGAGNYTAGSILLTAKDTLTLSGSRLSTDNFGTGSAVDGTGSAGDIRIMARNTTLQENMIYAQSTGIGDAGVVSIIGYDEVNLNSGNIISVATRAEGQGGTIEVRSNVLLTIDGSELIAGTEKRGQGGNIELHTDTLSFLNSLIDTTALGAGFGVGNGGNVDVRANKMSMHNSSIVARAQGTAKGDGSDGGDIVIDAPEGQISSQPLLIIGSQNIINADSVQGDSGNIEITDPDVDLDSELQQPVANFAAEPELLSGSCGPNAAMSTLTQNDEGGLSVSPDRYLTATAQTQALLSDTVADNYATPAALLAFLQHNPNEECR